MAPVNSVFSFEINLKKVEMFAECKSFNIRVQFADIFKIRFKSPNLKTGKKRLTKLTQANVKDSTFQKLTNNMIESASYTGKIDSLILSMIRYPIEISLLSKYGFDAKIGVAMVSWSPKYIEYLNSIKRHEPVIPVGIKGVYNIYDDYTSKKIAAVSLSIKLTYEKSFCGFGKDILWVYNDLQVPKTETIDNSIDDLKNIGIIKTTYGEGKRKFKNFPIKADYKPKVHSIVEETNTNEHSKDMLDNNKTSSHYLNDMKKPAGLKDYVIVTNQDLKSKYCDNANNSVYENKSCRINYVHEDRIELPVKKCSNVNAESMSLAKSNNSKIKTNSVYNYNKTKPLEAKNNQPLKNRIAINNSNTHEGIIKKYSKGNNSEEPSDLVLLKCLNGSKSPSKENKAVSTKGLNETFKRKNSKRETEISAGSNSFVNNNNVIDINQQADAETNMKAGNYTGEIYDYGKKKFTIQSNYNNEINNQAQSKLISGFTNNHGKNNIQGKNAPTALKRNLNNSITQKCYVSRKCTNVRRQTKPKIAFGAKSLINAMVPDEMRATTSKKKIELKTTSGIKSYVDAQQYPNSFGAKTINRTKYTNNTKAWFDIRNKDNNSGEKSPIKINDPLRSKHPFGTKSLLNANVPIRNSVYLKTKHTYETKSLINAKIPGVKKYITYSTKSNIGKKSIYTTNIPFEANITVEAKCPFNPMGKKEDKGLTKVEKNPKSQIPVLTKCTDEAKVIRQKSPVDKNDIVYRNSVHRKNPVLKKSPVRKFNTVRKHSPIVKSKPEGIHFRKKSYKEGTGKRGHKKPDKKGKEICNIVEPGQKNSTIETMIAQTDKQDALLQSHIQLNRLAVHSSITSFAYSDTAFNIVDSQLAVKESSSYFSITEKNDLKTFDYIFGDQTKCGNKVYCVGYCTVHIDGNSSALAPNQSKKGNKPKKVPSDENIEKNPNNPSLDDVIRDNIIVKKCDNSGCIHKKDSPVSLEKTVIDCSALQKVCCDDVSEKMLNENGEIQENAPPDSCFCACECIFGFSKKTTYCQICRGYKIMGDPTTPPCEMLFPCPIFHKLVDKRKFKISSSASDFNKKKSGEKMDISDDASIKTTRSLKGTDKKKTRKRSDAKTETNKKRQVDERFKFRYGFTGIPALIGHEDCASPCHGHLNPVPKSMGWLWTAEDTSGLKFRPDWKPGAISKQVFRLLKIAKDPAGVLSGKKRKRESILKRNVKRPLLVVHKKDGEFTITMERMKTYAKQRTLNQQPYEDRDPLTYTVGRTDEENRNRMKRKMHHQRQLEKEKRVFIQSAFDDMCHDICLKTYQQALAISPHAEDPPCYCFPDHPEKYKEFNEPCSCSPGESIGDGDISAGTETDDDEWFLEFTPPNALFDPKFKPKKKVKADNSSQYTYLDYRVKLLDRYGKQVPRFFKDLNGKIQCSDLGGFWNQDHKWQEINVDGFIGPDERWAPMIFIGPSGELVEAEDGRIQTMDGKWLMIGVDGFIDAHEKWKYYAKTKKALEKKCRTDVKKGAGDKKDIKVPCKPISEAAWSCFGDASPKELSKMGIVGHGTDKRLLLSTLTSLLAQGEDVKILQPSVVPRQTVTKRTKKCSGDSIPLYYDSVSYFSKKSRCKHAIPSPKGVIATDGFGNKTYFKLTPSKNARSRARLGNLKRQGKNLSAFHFPCFRSFTKSEDVHIKNNGKVKNAAT